MPGHAAAGHTRPRLNLLPLAFAPTVRASASKPCPAPASLPGRATPEPARLRLARPDHAGARILAAPHLAWPYPTRPVHTVPSRALPSRTIDACLSAPPGMGLSACADPAHLASLTSPEQTQPRRGPPCAGWPESLRRLTRPERAGPHQATPNLAANALGAPWLARQSHGKPCLAKQRQIGDPCPTRPSQALPRSTTACRVKPHQRSVPDPNVPNLTKPSHAKPGR